VFAPSESSQRALWPSSGWGIDFGSISAALALMVFEMLAKLFDETLEKKEPLVVW
jgi:hypothetical protein